MSENYLETMASEDKSLISTLSDLYLHISKCDTGSGHCGKCRAICDDMMAINEGMSKFVFKCRLLNLFLVILRLVLFPILYQIYVIRGLFRYCKYEYTPYRISNRLFANLSFIWSIDEFRNQVALHRESKEIYYDETMHRMICRGVGMQAPIVGVEVEGFLVGNNQLFRKWFNRTENDNLRRIFLNIVGRYYSILFWQERSFRRSHTVYIYILIILYFLLVYYIFLSGDVDALLLIFLFILSEPFFMFDYVISECSHVADFETYDRLTFYRNMINFQIAVFTLLLAQMSTGLVGGGGKDLVLVWGKSVQACGSSVFEFFSKWNAHDCRSALAGRYQIDIRFLFGIVSPYLSFLISRSMFKRHLDGLKRALDYKGRMG